MTYALAAPFQMALFGRLSSDPAIVAAIGDAVFDAPPEGPRPPVFIAIGPEDAKQVNDKTGRAAVHKVVVSLVSERPGFLELKELAALVDAALTERTLPLSRGAIVSLTFQRAKARRERTGTRRRIDMTFQAIVDDA